MPTSARHCWLVGPLPLGWKGCSGTGLGNGVAVGDVAWVGCVRADAAERSSRSPPSASDTSRISTAMLERMMSSLRERLGGRLGVIQGGAPRSEEYTSELQSRENLV